MASPDPVPEEPVVTWDEFEEATDLLVSDRRTPKKGQPRDPVNSR